MCRIEIAQGVGFEPYRPSQHLVEHGTCPLHVWSWAVPPSCFISICGFNGHVRSLIHVGSAVSQLALLLPQRDADVQALLDGNLLADGDILQYLVPRAQRPAAAAPAASDSQESCSGSGTAPRSNKNCVLASIVVRSAPPCWCCDPRTPCVTARIAQSALIRSHIMCSVANNACIHIRRWMLRPAACAAGGASWCCRPRGCSATVLESPRLSARWRASACAAPGKHRAACRCAGPSKCLCSYPVCSCLIVHRRCHHMLSSRPVHIEGALESTWTGVALRCCRQCVQVSSCISRSCSWES